MRRLATIESARPDTARRVPTAAAGILLLFLALAAPARAQETAFALAPDGTVPAWLVAGPFEQPIVGLGQIGDADALGEAEAAPVEGETAASPLVEGGEVAWKALHADARGFVDFHAALGWARPGEAPARIWWAKAGYAFVTIESPAAQEVLLLTGSNSRLRVVLNGEAVLAVDAERNAEPASDTTRLNLKPGPNRLLVKVGQSHRNEGVQFFEPLRWEWGFYARLVREDGTPADVRAVVPTRAAPPEADLVPTFFFREGEGGLEQRFDLVVTSRSAAPVAAEAEIEAGERAHRFEIGPVPFGESRHALWLPEAGAEVPARLTLRLGEEAIEREVVLAPQPKVELHLMLLSHNDIGYTDPQPIVQEKQARTLDEVLALCEAEPDFRWTVEAVWQLRQFETGRAPEAFERLMAQAARGCLAVSPLYANPYTGWVSEEEMLRQLDDARAYAERFGLRYRAAVYNDVPGFSWFVPAVLRGAGISFLVAGLNEIFNDYAFQRTLPKAFWWEGADGSRVLTYRTEAYNEGQNYGMVKGPAAMEQRMWERLHRLLAAGEPHELILLNTTFGDNGGVPRAELASARAWNERFAFPRIVVSHADAFAEAFERRYGDDLPSVRGDWTSTWDVLAQGELGRVVRQRWAQHQLPTAEALATVGWLLEPERAPLQPQIAAAYDALQQYSGHGSGLEYGYGSPEENDVTMAFRDGYVQEALLATEAVRERALYRIVQPEEAFETAALYVFNGLSWPRDAPLEVEFPETAAERYRVVDLESGAVLPSRHDGHTLRLVARELPAVGYRKLALQPRTAADDAAQADLALGEHAIENAFYRLAVDPATGAVTSLLDKKEGREMVPAGAPLPFGVPLREVAAAAPGFRAEPGGAVRVTVRDERPARVLLEVEREAGPVARTEYALWQGLDRVDVTHEVDLSRLGETDEHEEFAVAFPFALEEPEARLDVLGGFLDPARERFEGVEHDAVSIRRSAALSDGARSVRWAAVDSRVVRWREMEGTRVLLATLVNNFPEHWNRREVRAGTWPLRFRLAGHSGGLDLPAASRFGYEAAAEPVVRRTWLRTADPAGRFLEIGGEAVVLLALRPGEDGQSVLLRLMNTEPERPARAEVSSPLFEPASAWRVSLFGERQAELAVSDGRISVELGPSEVATVEVRLAAPSATSFHPSPRGTP